MLNPSLVGRISECLTYLYTPGTSLTYSFYADWQLVVWLVGHVWLHHWVNDTLSYCRHYVRHRQYEWQHGIRTFGFHDIGIASYLYLGVFSSVWYSSIVNIGVLVPGMGLYWHRVEKRKLIKENGFCQKAPKVITLCWIKLFRYLLLC